MHTRGNDECRRHFECIKCLVVTITNGLTNEWGIQVIREYLAESAPSTEVIESSDSEEQVQPENSNNLSSQNDTQNAMQRIYIDLVDDNEENEENEGQTEIIYISDEEEPDYDNEEELNYDNIKPNIMETQAEIRRRIHLYSQIRPQTEEEREYSLIKHINNCKFLRMTHYVNKYSHILA
ncbi:12152_t:CDS:2 [Ambispora leptoticha]|uniref:12152_t:CDS:1 n=1 Tax=Ambispora leptoticha TaxID=144679 RepID=A0A9N9GRB9_9GLOM|nr:12152_t:CDS:2 [Ambispora leptoticha]